MSQIIQKNVRKADMTAQNQYDWSRLVFSRKEFLESTYEESKEEILFSYETEGTQNFKEIKSEKREEILIALMDCAKLSEVCKHYKVQLYPENLYYDIHRHVKVMFRDVYGSGEIFEEEDFLNQYKALIGFALQDRYSFEDYYDGGMDLLNKDSFLKNISDIKSIKEIHTCLLEEYERTLQENKENKLEVNRKKYRRTKVALRITGVFLTIAIAMIGFYFIWERPYKSAVIEAEKSYLKMNYSGVIEAYRNVDMKRLSVYDKYILANSYIQSENLTEEQKKNTISALSLETNEKVLDYWIALGRLQTEEAENIAQQVSDNDLLLYAYLKEKNMLETDTEISGKDKSDKLADLEGKIEQLTEEK